MIDLSRLLKGQNLYPQFLWKKKNQEKTYIACGKISEKEILPSSSTLTFLGSPGFSHRYKTDPLWEPFFPFFSPAIEMTQISAPTLPFTFFASPEKREDFPNKNDWILKASHCIHRMQQNYLQKVVLARKTVLTFSFPLDPFQILNYLASKKGEATLFFFRPHPEITFLGLTPEHLFARDHQTLHSEAIAGTIRRKKGEKEDTAQKQTLLTSLKNRQEVDYVKDLISQHFSETCSNYSVDESPRILSTSHLHHLYYSFSGSLRKEITDAKLLEKLHPTPALGGYPRKEALDLIAELEPFNRGLYGAPLGLSSPRQSSFAVAIRSAIVYGRELHVFTGAGLIAKSHPEQEWEELEAKFSLFQGLYQ
jgi:menaquinone-specific isochorismate synthase